MINALEFVKGALTPKDQFFKISGGYVIGSNSTMELRAPINLQLEACPEASTFIKAIDTCDDVIAITLQGEQLNIACGNFQSNVKCIPPQQLSAFAYENYTYCRIPCIEAFTALLPFINKNASHPWSRGIYLSGTTAMATNNIIVAKYFLNTSVPTINIPEALVQEVVRVGIEPYCVGIGERTVQFYYEDGRTITGVTIDINFPNVDKIFTKEINWQPLQPELFKFVNKLLKFANGNIIYFDAEEQRISTEKDIAQGSHFTKYPVMFTGCINGAQFLLLREMKQVDWALTPILFGNDNMLAAMAPLNG